MNRATHNAEQHAITCPCDWCEWNRVPPQRYLGEQTSPDRRTGGTDRPNEPRQPQKQPTTRTGGTLAPDIARLQSIVAYDALTGVLTWLERPRDHFASRKAHTRWNSQLARRRAGRVNNGGYVILSISGDMLLAHRVAWAIHHGKWPDGVIDHINHNRADNRITNLRDVPQSENAKNLSMAENNKSGRTGISWHKASRKWRAQIGFEGVNYHLGVFDVFDLACNARDRAEQRGDFHDNHGKPAKH